MTDHPLLPVDLAGAHALILSLTERVSNAEAHATASRNEVENARRTARVERAASDAAKVEAALAKAARIALEVEIEHLKLQIAKLTTPAPESARVRLSGSYGQARRLSA